MEIIIAPLRLKGNAFKLKIGQIIDKFRNQGLKGIPGKSKGQIIGRNRNCHSHAFKLLVSAKTGEVQNRSCANN
jgi:ABC-type iron transport system FetAB permease component